MQRYGPRLVVGLIGVISPAIVRGPSAVTTAAVWTPVNEASELQQLEAIDEPAVAGTGHHEAKLLNRAVDHLKPRDTRECIGSPTVGSPFESHQSRHPVRDGVYSARHTVTWRADPGAIDSLFGPQKPNVPDNHDGIIIA